MIFGGACKGKISERNGKGVGLTEFKRNFAGEPRR